MHFRSPINSKSHELTKIKSGISHIMHHKIHSHIRYKFEVLQNIKDNNDSFRKKRNLTWNKILCPSKEKKKKKVNENAKKIKTNFFSYLFVFFLIYLIDFYSL